MTAAEKWKTFEDFLAIASNAEGRSFELIDGQIVRKVMPGRKPTGFPVDERPDWVCEVSQSTKKKDTTIVPETMAAEGVPFYWLLDVESENLQVFELIEPAGKYALIQSLFRDDGEVAIKPFDAVKFNINVLLGDDED